ncbi:hypothetical protein EVAR_52795_1 [Eumeta japonica]|uniref:Uncharacterized protein n=1 Tax=Eumeta variegata TaxID=151549 RepID=A0A4C1Y6A0_EUMVA|nr:hypothetical protein EVAR_52795_1 [Eumeta japonica]
MGQLDPWDSTHSQNTEIHENPISTQGAGNELVMSLGVANVHGRRWPPSLCAARGRPIIVEWERDARHSAGLSRSVTHRYVTERYTFQSDSQPQPNLRRCHVKIKLYKLV